jgi:signal transduction histidine kinase
MPSSTRQLGLALIFFLVWLVAASSAQLWLRAEDQHARIEALVEKRAQFELAVGLLPRTGEGWNEQFRHDLGALLGAIVEVETAATPAAPPPGGALRFKQPLPGADGPRVVVTFQPAGAIRLAVLQQRMLAAITLLGLLFVLVIVIVGIVRKPNDDRHDESRLPEARTEIGTLQHLARVSAESTAALASETDARRRAEENLELSRTLLDQSLEDRVRLGRDLHDNLCQTLYAVSLNLEGVRKRLRQQPADAEENLATCMEELRTANRQVRAYIAGLSPAAVRGHAFVEALQGMLASLGNLAGIQFGHHIDAEAAALLTPEQATEAMQIAREAVSNAVRHGGARAVTVHVQRDERELVLAVHDNGSGFDPQTAAGAGHGLDNMNARAAAAGGKLRVVSTPGQGARVALILPIAAT